MKLRSLILCGLATLLCGLAILALVIDGRFRDCVRDAYYNPNTLTTPTEDIREGCARQMGVFRRLYEKHPD